ncbi:MAG: aminomethyltransferase family protein [Halobacteriales archaeon]
MTDLRAFHEEHGAVFGERDGRTVVERYRRPERTHRAVRNGVGVTEEPYGVVVVEGEDRVEYVDDVLTNRVPRAEGEGAYALLLDPQGRIETDMAVYNAGERLLLFVAPGRAAPTVEGWEAFLRDVEFRVATGEFAVFGVHGPDATEKVASVLDVGTPEDPRSFVRGTLRDTGVTVARGDDPAGEESYEVVCGAGDAVDVLDTLLNHGLNAVPFGRETWNALTLEAGTPLFRTELEGRLPNAVGLRDAVDFEKGCYVGQEVVSRIENRGRPPERLVGLRPEACPERGAAVFDGDAAVGEVTRAVESPVLEAPVALAAVDPEASDSLTVRVDGDPVPAGTADLPFVEGSGRSGRLPRYGDA